MGPLDLLWYTVDMDTIKILDNFVDNETCDFIIEIYKKLFEHKKPSYDGRKVLTNPKNEQIYNFLREYMPKLSKVLGTNFYIRDLLLSVYEEGAFVEPHIDFTDIKLKESLGALFYFNDNFEGGEVYFTKYSFEYKPKKGSVLIFPCNSVEYEHGVKPVTSGIRYTMPIEINSDKSLEVVKL